MAEQKAKVVHYTQVPAKLFGDTAPGTSIRWLIDEENDGAPYYAMRMIEIEPGGSSPQHEHPYEHENFVVEGKGRLFIAGEWHDLNVGDVAFVPAGILHQYVNAGDSTLKFLCSIPVKKYQSQ